MFEPLNRVCKCFMVKKKFFVTEKKVWTVLSHNSTAPVKVQNSSPQKPHITEFSYNASADQLRAIVSGSEQCQQEVVYKCRKSRLFNTKGGLFPLRSNLCFFKSACPCGYFIIIQYPGHISRKRWRSHNGT